MKDLIDTQKEDGWSLDDLDPTLRGLYESSQQEAESSRAPISGPGADSPASTEVSDLVADLEKYLVNRHRLEKRHSLALPHAQIADHTRQINDLAHRRRSRPPLGAGSQVAGAKLREELGSGTFATVWLSEHVATGELTATKIFDLGKLSQGIMLWRFRRSIRALRRLTECEDAPRSIVRLRESSNDGLAFTMDYLAGRDLAAVTASARGWDLGRKIAVFLEICRAVGFAHSRGVIHRDIKPANVVMTSDGFPVLTDFDIADVDSITRLSVAEPGLGTPMFAAPEQFQNGDRATKQSDVYSLGRLLFFLLADRPPSPHVEENLEKDLAELRRVVPPTIVAIVRRATQYKPTRRYANVDELVTDLAGHNEGVRLARARLVEGLSWIWKRRAIVLSLGAGLLSWSFWDRTASPGWVFPEFGHGFARPYRSNVIDRDFDYHFERCEARDGCLPGASHSLEIRVARKDIGWGVVSFEKGTDWFTFGDAKLKGDEIMAKIITDPPQASVQLNVEDAHHHAPFFRCKIPDDGIVKLSKKDLDGVNLDEIKYFGVGASHDAETPDQITIKLLGVVSLPPTGAFHAVPCTCYNCPLRTGGPHPTSQPGNLEPKDL